MTDSEAYRFWMGVDWGCEQHVCVVIDREAKTIASETVPHSGAGIATLIAAVLAICDKDPTQVAVAIETPRGPVVEGLMERGFDVYAVNPKQLDRFRDRHTVAGAKDDRRDAFVLADSLRTDRQCFRRTQVDDPRVIELRELSRIDDELGRERRQLANRVRDQLLRFFPQVLELCPAADEPWFWALLEIATSPAAAAKLRKASIDRLLREHRIRRLSAADVLPALKAPALHVAPGTAEAAGAHIQLLIERLRLVDRQQKRSLKRIEALLDELTNQQSEHRDVLLLRSLPGLGPKGTATMLAEASQLLRARDYHGLRGQSGVAPVTRATGKRSGPRASVSMRRACSARLRETVYHWSRVSAQHDPATRMHYAQLRKKGHSHGRALRGVGDRLLRILVGMLKAGTTYNPLLQLEVATPNPAA